MKLPNWMYFIFGALYFVPFFYYIGKVILDFDIPNNFLRSLGGTIISIIIGVLYLLIGFGKLNKNKFGDWSLIIGLIGFLVMGIFFLFLAKIDSGLAAIGLVAMFGLPIMILMGASVILLIISLIEKSK